MRKAATIARIAVITLIGLSLFPGCQSHPDRSSSFRVGQGSFDLSAIDSASLRTDPNVEKHIIYMPFGEAAARLGSMKFQAETKLKFNRGKKHYEQVDRYAISQDSRGHFHLQLDSPINQVEAYLIGADFYVRHDWGPLRRKPRRDVNVERLGDLAFASLSQTLQLFRPGLQFGNPERLRVADRETLKFPVTLQTETAAQPVPSSKLPQTTLPVRAPALWRELSRPLDLAGAIWVDAATGVVVRADIRGKLEISDQEIHPTQLSVTYQADISEIARLRPIEIARPNKVVDEFKRKPPPRNLLGFYQNQLPKQPSEDASP